VWLGLRKRLHLKAYKISNVQNLRGRGVEITSSALKPTTFRLVIWLNILSVINVILTCYPKFWTMDSLYAFKCKRFRNTRHKVTFEIPLQSSFLNTLHYQWKSHWTVIIPGETTVCFATLWQFKTLHMSPEYIYVSFWNCKAPFWNTLYILQCWNRFRDKDLPECDAFEALVPLRQNTQRSYSHPWESKILQRTIIYS
jgi:hypothetical protein